MPGKQEVNNFFQNAAFYIALGIAVLIIVVLLIIYLKNRNKKDTSFDFYKMLGGKDNVNDLSLKGSRLSFIAIDITKIDFEAFNSYGLKNKMITENKVTMIFDSYNVKNIKRYL